MDEKFVPVYARANVGVAAGTDILVEKQPVSFFLRLADGTVMERDGVTGALIGVYELRSVG